MSKGFTGFALIAALLGIYLFASAPPPLPEASARSGKSVPVQVLFEICAAENAAVRELYTKDIVAAGQGAGLAFDERWRDAGVQAGPLPALFLRESSQRLAQNAARLGMFLGSDQPITPANRFSGAQAQAFEQMRRDRKPRFFVSESGLHTAMFPDLAVSEACVSCHNEHEKTPKRDWKLGDMMGATTFTYPSSEVSLDEALRVIAALRDSFHGAYAAYTDQAKTFSSPPAIGGQWPTSGYSLPDPARFMAEAERRASSATLARLLAMR